MPKLFIAGLALVICGLLVMLTAQFTYYVHYPELTPPQALRKFGALYLLSVSCLLLGMGCIKLGEKP